MPQVKIQTDTVPDIVKKYDKYIIIDVDGHIVYSGRNDTFSRILDRTSIETGLEVSFSMDDYDNWDNGRYYGDWDVLKTRVSVITDELKQIMDEYRDRTSK